MCCFSIEASCAASPFVAWFDTKLKIPEENMKLVINKLTVIALSALSFYASEKTLRAAFEGYGELVEVKIIMDKILKAASAGLREMNGKIINGWMIVVDVANTSPPRYLSRGQTRPATR